MWLVFSALGESDSAWLTGIMGGELALYVPSNCSMKAKSLVKETDLIIIQVHTFYTHTC
jgi:hypothetical protein